MNPLNSPWNTPKFQTIDDQLLYVRWKAIKKHLKKAHPIAEGRGILSIAVGTVTIYIAKKSPKMRLKSHLDWSWYTPKTLAQAMDSGRVEEYYEMMLKDCRSDPNVWKDLDEEMSMKAHYAAREGRATEI
jgi:hypothetical protein